MYNGMINVYKEKGYTSHDVVAKMRGILKQKKIGHTGTLDPDAEGVLPVCLGQGTKLSDMLTDQSKAYRTVLLLGVETDTQDSSGKVLNRNDSEPDRDLIRQTILGFIGPYQQVPPMYSALKINGKKLYQLAREGREIERPARPVEILDIEISAVDFPRVAMDVTCTKGTYIRTLCHDIGRALGIGGCMEQLTRTRAGQFPIAQSLTLSQIEELTRQDQLTRMIIPVDQIFSALPKAVTKDHFDYLVHNGNPLKKEHFVEIESLFGEIRVYDSGGRFMGIYQFTSEKQWFKPRKMFLGGD